MDYNSFVKNAIEQYDKLPQETSQLYKKHYVNIPFDLKRYVDAEVGDERKELTAMLNDGLKDLKIKFDAALGSSECVASSSNGMSVTAAATQQGDKSKFESGEDKYVAFIHAYSKNNITINVKDNQEAKLNLLFSNSNRPFSSQIAINVGDGAKLSVYELYASRATQTSALGTIHDITVGSNSKVELNCLRNENASTVSLGFCKATVGDDSIFRFNTYYNGGSYARARNRITAKGIRSNVAVDEMIFGSGEQKADISTVIVNAGQESSASLETKAAQFDNSFTIMKGFAKLEKGASKSRSYVHERGILLDKGAKVDGLPDMSVDENDVKATHSSATAPVDAEAIFYLMSKGIDEPGVKKLIVTGFFADSLSRMGSYVMKQTSMSLIHEKLKSRAFGQIPKIDMSDMWTISQHAKEDIFQGHYKYRVQ